MANDESRGKERDAARATGAVGPYPARATGAVGPYFALPTRASGPYRQRRSLSPSVMLLALLGLACRAPDADDEAAALRADSSAAGYDVGPVADAGADTRPASSAAPEQPARTPEPRDSPVAVAKPGADTTPATRTRSTGVRTPTPQVVPPGDATSPMLIARIRVNDYLEYEPKSRSVYIDIIATRAATIDSTSVAGDTLSFNGSRDGRHSVTVPLGWNVVGQFVNRDPVHPHSAIVIEEVYPLPMVPPPAAFPQAFTRRVEDGLALNVRDDMSFSADREGRFLIVCGIPGHAEGGQRMQLVVTSEVNVPAYGR